MATDLSEWDDEELQKRVAAMPALFFLNMHTALTAAGEDHIAKLSGFHRATPKKNKRQGGRLSRITGTLLDAHDYRVTPRRGSVNLPKSSRATPSAARALKELTFHTFFRAGPGAPQGERTGRKTVSPYARIHEEGGEIRPVNAKVLTVPVGVEAFTQKGDQRYSSVRQVPNGYWWPRKGSTQAKKRAAEGKPPLFFQKVEGKGKDNLLFAGLKSVTIPARLRSRETFEKLAPRRETFLRRAIQFAASGRLVPVSS